MHDPHEIADHLLDHGLIFQGSPGTGLHPQPWAYTVGRTMLGRPEFLVTGLTDQQLAEMVLRTAVDTDDESELAAGDMLDTQAVGRCFLIEADPGALLGALVTFGLTKVRALQIVWPGDEHEQPIHAVGSSPFYARDTDPYLEES